MVNGGLGRNTTSVRMCDVAVSNHYSPVPESKLENCAREMQNMNVRFPGDVLGQPIEAILYV